MSSYELIKKTQHSVSGLPIVISEYRPLQASEYRGRFCRLEFGEFFEPTRCERLGFEPFQTHLKKLGDLPNVKVTMLTNQFDDPNTIQTVRVDLAHGPIVSLFIALSEMRELKDSCLSNEKFECGEYLNAKRICSNIFNLNVSGSPLLLTSIPETNKPRFGVHYSQLYLPQYSEMKTTGTLSESEIKDHCDTFILNHYNNLFLQPLNEAFDYLTHYITRLTNQ